MKTVPENINNGKWLHTSGVDPLMAADFRTWILTQVKIEIRLFDVLSAEVLGAGYENCYGVEVGTGED